MSGYEWFAPVYDTWAADMTEDVDYYVALAREAEGPIIELAAGSGRISIPIAQRTGKRVIGIDLSTAMLDIARARAAEAGVDVELHERDMRDLDFEQASDLVICPYRALLHLPTWGDRRRVFERVARALRPGGRFAWNAFVFDHRVAAASDETWEDEPLRHLTTYAPGDNRVDITIEGLGTLSNTVARSGAVRTRRATGVVLAAMKRKIVLWSNLRISGRQRGFQRQRW